MKKTEEKQWKATTFTRNIQMNWWMAASNMFNVDLSQQSGNPDNSKDGESDFTEAAARPPDHRITDVSRDADLRRSF